MSLLLGERLSVRRIAVAVAVGLLVAAAVVYGIYAANQPSDFDCAAQRADVALGNLQPYDVDDACR